MKNAAVHQANPFLLTMDFQDFFPSLRPRDLRRAIARSGRLTLAKAELRLVDHLLFWKASGLPGLSGLRLSSGAPSSPAVSNAVMHELDVAIAELCRKRRIRYTRYADDLTFSGKSEAALLVAFGQIGALIRRTRVPRLTVHADKTVFSSKGTRREVTGLTLTHDGKLSIGRDRKALIRDQVERFRRGRLPEADGRRLGGLIAFAQNVEPDFVQRLTHKHGVELMDRIRTGG